MPKRIAFDKNEYHKIASKECFICNIVNGGEKRNEHVIIDETTDYIAFLNNYPTQAGQILVCPKKHVRHIFKDLSEDKYSELFSYAKKIGTAVQKALDADRMYLASLGSNELNDHVHLHIFPLPPNIPFEEQQFEALNHHKRGILEMTKEEKQELAEKIKQKING